MKKPRTDARRKYEREYKRRRRADPACREHDNARERKRMSDLEKRRAKNQRERARLKANEESRKRELKRRAELTRKQQQDPQWRERNSKWQADYFARHCEDGAFRKRRDSNRVKLYYGVDDPLMVEALSLVRAFKRKAYRKAHVRRLLEQP